MGGSTHGADLRTRFFIPDPTRSDNAPTQIGAVSVAATKFAFTASWRLAGGAGDDVPEWRPWLFVALPGAVTIRPGDRLPDRPPRPVGPLTARPCANGPAVDVALVVLAIAQIGIHLVFFLHLTTAPDHINNALALAFGLLVVCC